MLKARLEREEGAHGGGGAPSTASLYDIIRYLQVSRRGSAVCVQCVHLMKGYLVPSRQHEAGLLSLFFCGHMWC